MEAFEVFYYRWILPVIWKGHTTSASLLEHYGHRDGVRKYCEEKKATVFWPHDQGSEYLHIF